MMDGEERSPLEIQRILEERARLLARAPHEEDTGESIEVAVVALDVERYGIEIETISEIQPLGGVTPVPGLPSYWVGLVNLRSHLVPLLDLRAYLGLAPFPFGGEEGNGGKGSRAASPAAEQGGPLPEGQIILVDKNGDPVGLLVDHVIEVRELSRAEIGPSLRKPTSAERKITEGLTPDLLTILDLDKLLADPRLVVRDDAG